MADRKAYDLFVQAESGLCSVTGMRSEPARIAISMFDVMAEWLTVPLLNHKGGKSPQRLGLVHPSVAPYGVFATKDGIQILITVQSNRDWAKICAEDDAKTRSVVETVLADIETRGDAAVRDLSEKFDHYVRSVSCHLLGGKFPMVASAHMSVATTKVADVPGIITATPPFNGAPAPLSSWR